MERERLREGLEQCKKDKKAVTVKSVSIKNQNGDRFLTNVSQIPLIDGNGEFQGVMMVIDDVTNIVGMQAEIERKQEEMKDLDRRFKETFTRLKLADMAKNGASKIAPGPELDNRIKELDHTDRQKMVRELINESIKLGGDKAIVGELQSGTKEELGLEERSEEGEESTWKEKLRIYDKIDECLDATEDNIKTKKLTDDKSE